MKGVVNQIKDGCAIVEFECKDMIAISTSCLPPFLKEGDVIINDNGKYLIDYEETRWLREAVKRSVRR